MMMIMESLTNTPEKGTPKPVQPSHSYTAVHSSHTYTAVHPSHSYTTVHPSHRVGVLDLLEVFFDLFLLLFILHTN